MAIHPSSDGIVDRLQLNNAALKQRALDRGVSLDHTDQRINTCWNSTNYLVLTSQAIRLKNNDGKTVWSLLQKEMPQFALFRADRPSRDGDDEVTNPLTQQ